MQVQHALGDLKRTLTSHHANGVHLKRLMEVCVMEVYLHLPEEVNGGMCVCPYINPLKYALVGECLGDDDYVHAL